MAALSRSAPVVLVLGAALAGCNGLMEPASSGPTAAGNPAPEIEGKDVDGKPFKLSDYRGKVVLLDFWGNW
jgi:cytochrome oxidase Cu insertion factor (SCO1/SenC/PrrC family)